MEVLVEVRVPEPDGFLLIRYQVVEYRISYIIHSFLLINIFYILYFYCDLIGS